MFLFSIIVSAILVVAALVQLVIAIAFEKSFNRNADQARRFCQNLQNEESPPLVAVVLGIRGWDPSLQNCLTGLLNQTWPNLQIQIIIDNRHDAAWRRIHQIKEDFDQRDRMQISELHEPYASCSLKCSAMIRGLENLSDDVQYVATIDADVTPHPTWLTELISPLMMDAEIGLVTGNQWFEPPIDGNWGAYVRSTWSAGSLVLSTYFANPWAGSMAMRRQQIEQLDLIECWKRSAVDDGPLVGAFIGSNLQRHFVPSLVMVNRENCTMGYAASWMKRMLTWSRLYEPTFYLTILHAVFSNMVMIAVFISLFYLLWHQAGTSIAIPLLSLIVSGLLSVAAYLAARRVAEKSCQISGRRLPPLPIKNYWRLFWCVPLAQGMFFINCVAALLVKRIRWRGIWYQINPDRSIRMLQYQPYESSETQDALDSQNSIG